MPARSGPPGAVDRLSAWDEEQRTASQPSIHPHRLHGKPADHHVLSSDAKHEPTFCRVHGDVTRCTILVHQAAGTGI
jgi:hypothetical protein